LTCEFSSADGAYVLGALAPDEHEAFERHLPECVTCREAVATLAVVPGLLRRLDPASALATLSTPPAPQSLLNRTLTALAGRRRAQRRRQMWYAATGLAAAVLATAVLTTVVGVGGHDISANDAGVPPGYALTEMRPAVANIPLTAQLGLVATEDGTWVDMTCRYAAGHDARWVVRLVVYPLAGGRGEQIGTWTATPGRELSLAAVTHLAPADIDRVELQRGDTTTLLVWHRG